MITRYRWRIFNICLVLSIVTTIYVLVENVQFIDDGFHAMLMRFESDALVNYFRYMTFWANIATVMVIGAIITIVSLIMKKKIGLYLVGTVFITGIVNQGLKLIFSRPRPIDIDLVAATGYSFPSGHTMMGVSFYGFLMFMMLNSKCRPRTKWMINSLLLFLIVNIAISRIYLGVHFFTDIVMSVLISSCILLVVTYVYSKFYEKGH